MTDLSQKFGETTITLGISTQGSWIGDLFLSLSSASPTPDQILLDDDQAHIIVKEVGGDSLRITPPGASPVPLLYMALYGVMTELSPTFNKRALSNNGYAKEKKQIRQMTLEPGIFVAQVDIVLSSVVQLVTTIDDKSARFYFETAFGYPPQNGHGAEWTIQKSPELVMLRKDINQKWHDVFKAAVIHSQPGRKPFSTLLVENPAYEGRDLCP